MTQSQMCQDPVLSHPRIVTMASFRTGHSGSILVRLGAIAFIVLSLSTGCSGWDRKKCPNFCQCFFLYGLKWADCTGHRLYSVQTGVDETVQALDLSNNSISSLANYELRDAGLTRLKLLNVSSNAISEIGLMAFLDLSHLRVLDLSNNHLYAIHPETFAKNKRLEILQLAGNNLNQRVPKLQSSSLGSLDLSNCGISHLPSSTFDGLPRLRALDITNNVMIQLDLEIWKGLPNLAVLMMERNPWSCNSNMYELQNRLRAKRIIFKRVCNESPESNDVPRKFGKMIAPEKPSAATNHRSGYPRLIVDLKNWKNSLKLAEKSNRCEPRESWNEVLREKSHDSKLANLSPYWFLAFGFLLGSAVSTVCTYCWLALSKSRHQLLGRGTLETESSEIANQRVNLLQHLYQNNDDTSRPASSCPGTPPPPYRDVMLHGNRYPRSDIRAGLSFVNEESMDERQINS